MIRLAIVVEGQTEEAFVNQVLLNHLLPVDVVPTPFLIGRRGGNVTVNRLAVDMTTSFWNFDYVTSLVDFYGFRDRGLGGPDALQIRISEAVDSLIKRNWNKSRVFPYVQCHEFESLLFAVAFEENVFLVTKAKAKALKATPEDSPQTPPEPTPSPEPAPQPGPESGSEPESSPDNQKTMLRLTGTVPPEVWNRLGIKMLPKLRSGEELSVGIEFTVSVRSQFAQNMETELRQVLDDLELAGQVRVERS